MACRQSKYPYISEKRTDRSLGICYFKVIEGQVSLSALFGTPRVRVNSLFFGYFDGLENTCLWSCETIYAINFSLFLNINSLDAFV